MRPVRIGAMKTITRSIQFIITVAMLSMAGGLSAAESVVTPAMIGHWEGDAQIVVSWCHQKTLTVKVDIHADGSISGTVGDAALTDGRFLSNRGWLLRKLNWATDYIIEGGLNGPLVAAEGITRANVKIPLNFNDGRFEGGVNTSGSGFEGFSGKSGEGTWLAARNLRLVRSK